MRTRIFLLLALVATLACFVLLGFNISKPMLVVMIAWLGLYFYMTTIDLKITDIENFLTEASCDCEGHEEGNESCGCGCGHEH